MSEFSENPELTKVITPENEMKSLKENLYEYEKFSMFYAANHSDTSSLSPSVGPTCKLEDSKKNVATTATANTTTDHDPLKNPNLFIDILC